MTANSKTLIASLTCNYTCNYARDFYSFDKMLVHLKLQKCFFIQKNIYVHVFMELKT